MLWGELFTYVCHGYGGEEARSCLGAFAILAGGAINDILYAQGIINTGHVVTFSTIGFILLQSAIIARHFARAFERDASNRALLETYNQLDAELLKQESLQAINISFNKTTRPRDSS